MLIRSAATDYDLQGRIRGILDMPLAAAGIAEAERAADAARSARPQAVYAANAACALETAGIVARACGLAVRRLKPLRGFDQGLWQGMLVEELCRRQPRLARQWQEHPWSIAPPEGESLEAACSRVEDALETILDRHAAGRVVLVVPPPLDRLVRWLVSGEPLDDLWRTDAASLLLDIPLAAQWRPARERQPTA